LREAFHQLYTLPRRLKQAVHDAALLEEIEPWLWRLEQVTALALELLDQIDEEDLHPRHILSRLEAIRETNEAVVCDGWIERWIRETIEELTEG
jgi:hypothetical protein